MQEHVHLENLVKSFPTSISLQNLVSIQPITSPIKPRPEIQFSHTYHARCRDLVELCWCLRSSLALSLSLGLCPSELNVSNFSVLQTELYCVTHGDDSGDDNAYIRTWGVWGRLRMALREGTWSRSLRTVSTGKCSTGCFH